MSNSEPPALRRLIDVITANLGDGFANQGAGISGSTDGGFELNPDCSPEDARKTLEALAKHITPGQWEAACEQDPGLLPVLIPRAK